MECEWRAPGCHSQCEGYRKFKDEIDKRKALREEALKDEKTWVDVHCKNKDRTSRRIKINAYRKR